MSKCKEKGCRKLATICQDCERTVCTATRQEALDPNDWYDIDAFPPGIDQPCEYRITVACQGWYKGDQKEHVFAPDDRVAPETRIVSWRPLKDGQNWEDGRRDVLAFREQQARENQPFDGGPTA